MRVLQFKKPTDYLGQAIKIFLKDGGAFNFKVTGVNGSDNLTGFDDEGLNITIPVDEIDYILGGNGNG